MRSCAIILLVLLSSLVMHAQDDPLLSRTYEPSFRKGTVKSFLEDIQQNTGVSLSFSVASIPAGRQVKLEKREYTIEEALNQLLLNKDLVYAERNQKILIIPVSEARRYVQHMRYTINGYVKEKGTKEALIGATVHIPALQAGITTNSYGYYSLSLPAGRYRLVCSYIGYAPDTLDIILEGNKRLDIQLQSYTYLSTVQVVNETPVVPGHSHITAQDLQSKPMLLGETDVMRALQTEPGVQMGMEGSNNIYVRGGEPGQNLHLLDGVPLYYTNHFGFTSIFNADAIKSVDFHKGAFRASHGGRVSSIVEVNTKDGDMQQWGGSFNMGLLKTSLNIEGPIVKDKASVMISGRRTWVDALWRPFTNDLKFDFHDLNIKANYIANQNNRFYLSFYTGRDQLGIGETLESYNNRSGNTILSAKWATIVTPKLFVNTLLTYSKYRFNSSGEMDMIFGDSLLHSYSYRIRSSISDLAGQIQTHWYPNRYHHIEAGGRIATTDFVPTVAESVTPLMNTTGVGPGPAFKAHELSFYLEDNIQLGDKWLLRPGLRWSNWFNPNFNYNSFQPRFYAAYTPVANHTVHTSFSHMTQFLHNIGGGFTSMTLFNNLATWNTEAYVPSSETILPEEAWMVTLGYTARPISGLEFGIDLYYKDMAQVPMMDPRKFVYDNAIPWDEKVIQGKGWSYGTEFFVKKQIGHVGLSAAYTLSWNRRQYAQLNDGASFPFRYDRRNNLNISAMYKPGNKFDASATWTYMSGEAITLPDYIYPDHDNNLLVDYTGTYFGNLLYNYSYSSVNNYRLPSVHRLDLAFNFHKRKRKRMERTWAIGMFNVYGRTNIMYVELLNNTDGLKLSGNGFLKFIPYACYKLKF